MAADGPGWTIFVKEKMAMTEFQILGNKSLTRSLLAAMSARAQESVRTQKLDDRLNFVMCELTDPNSAKFCGR